MTEIARCLPPVRPLIGSIHRLNETLAILSHLSEEQTFPARLATLVRVEGSSYRRAGARLLVDATGTRIGSISGGCLEEDLLARMNALGPARRSEVVVYDTTSENDVIWGVGTGCHGVVHIIIEYIADPPPWAREAWRQLQDRKRVGLYLDWDDSAAGCTRLADDMPPVEKGRQRFVQNLEPPHHLVLFGAGADAQPLVRFAKSLGWTVTVIDPRSELVRAEHWPDADATRCLPAEDAASAVAWDGTTAAVIMTHHYRYDLPLLAALLPLNLTYLGLLGPRRRAERLLRDLPADAPGAARRSIDRLHAPVGLDLGGDGPEVVALAIVAEIQARFARRDARPLRERDRGIHDA